MNIKKHLILLTMFMVISAVPLISQSNEYIDTLLNLKSVPMTDTAYLIFLSKDDSFSNKQPLDAKDLLLEKYRLDGNEITTAKELARLCMTEYQFPGGLLFRMSKSGRYAFRDMKYLGLMKGINNPAKVLTPEEILRIISNSHDLWRENQ